jgi:zinc/manganese transport system substrate-binding protein
MSMSIRIRCSLPLAVLVVVGMMLTGCSRPGTGVSVTTAAPGTILVIAVENFYGSMVASIGGRRVTVSSLLTNPDADPHEFEASSSTAQALSRATVVVDNGLGYDAWVDHLLSASPRSGRVVVTMGSVLHRTTGDNPHLWYDPTAWNRMANAIEHALAGADPGHSAEYEAGRARFERGLVPVRAEIARLRTRLAGRKIGATEPVFGYMASALGLDMQHTDFQKAVMDGTDPPPRAVSSFLSDLRERKLSLLVYNSQTNQPITTHIRSLAQSSGVPTIGVSELEPHGTSFAQWQLRQLRALGAARLGHGG